MEPFLRFTSTSAGRELVFKVQSHPPTRVNVKYSKFYDGFDQLLQIAKSIAVDYDDVLGKRLIAGSEKTTVGA